MPDHEKTKSPFLAAFENEDHAKQYAKGPALFLPGMDALHRMTSILLRERAPDDARVLVHGAGGGLELSAFATANPKWTFIGVDPARAMLDAARTLLGENANRAELVHGYIDDAPVGPFDAATSLLTLHFLDPEERERTVREIVRRLRPGAPFVVAHSSYPQAEPARTKWLKRYAAFAVASGAEPEMAEKALEAVRAADTMLDPDVDQQILERAGLQDVEIFYTAFTWRGWIGYAP